MLKILFSFFVLKHKPSNKKYSVEYIAVYVFFLNCFDVFSMHNC